MTLEVKHSTVIDGVAYPDDPTKPIGTNDWNATHTLQMASGYLLGRASSGAGAVEELPPGSVATLLSGNLTSETVTSRSALKALDTTRVVSAYLAEGSRSGTFVWTSGNYADRVSADTAEAVYIASNTVATTSGAWVRQWSGGVDPHWFGAVGDGVTDDYAALAAALSFAGSDGRPCTVQLRDALYVASATLVVPTSVFVRGVGHGGGTIIYGSHSDGPVIALDNIYSGVTDIEVNATTARRTGSATGTGGVQNTGITVRGLYNTIDRVRAYYQPSDGILSSGLTYMSVIRNVTVASNLGHGICIDPGDRNGDSPSVPGLMEIHQPTLNDNAGHALAIGRPSSSGSGAKALRVVARNVDLDNNGSNAALLYTDTQIYMHGVNLTLENSAVAAGGSKLTQGVYVQGSSIKLINNRFFDLKGDTDAYVIGGSTDTTGVLIDGISINSGLTLAVVVNIGASIPAGAVTIVPRNETGYTTLTTWTNAPNIILGAQMQLPLGSASAPTYSFAGDPNSGFYASAADAITCATGGTARWTVSGSLANFSVPVKTPSTTVASLPSAATVGAGARMLVTDASGPTFQSFQAIVVGGGSYIVPVYSDGTNWRMG